MQILAQMNIAESACPHTYVPKILTRLGIANIVTMPKI